MKDTFANPDARKFYLFVTIGFAAQVFLIWCWGSDTMSGIKLLALLAPALITWSWNHINRSQHWDVSHHVIGRISLFWFFPCFAGILTCAATTVWFPLTMVPMIYLASMALWSLHMPRYEIE